MRIKHDIDREELTLTFSFNEAVDLRDGLDATGNTPYATGVTEAVAEEVDLFIDMVEGKDED